MNSEKRVWNQSSWNKWKNWIILGLILIVIGIFVFDGRKKPSPIVDTNPILQKAERLKDENDKLYAKIEAYAITNAQARAFSDSLAKALKIKAKYIKGVDKYIYVIDTLFVDSIRVVGDSTGWSITKKDAWVSIEARKLNSGVGTIRFSSKDTLTRTEVVKDPLIGRTKRFVTIRNANPYNHLDAGYSWSVKEKRAWLTVGPYVGLDVLTMKPSLGVSVQIPIIQFKR